MKTQDLIVGRTYQIKYSVNQTYSHNGKKLYYGVGVLLKLSDGWGNRLHEFRLVEDANGTYPNSSGPIVFCTANGVVAEKGVNKKMTVDSSYNIELVEDWKIRAKEIIEMQLLDESVQSTVSMLNGLGVGASFDNGRIVIKAVDAIKMGEILKPVFLHYSKDLLGD